MWRCISPTIFKAMLFVKLSLVLILISSLQLTASVLLGQQVSVKVNASLADVLEDLNEQTGTYFMYNESEIDDDAMLKLDMISASLEEVLDEICTQTPVKYEIVEDFVILTKNEPDSETIEVQEKKTIKGKVTDEDGNPLPGVSIVIKGTTMGVATDIEGNYSLELEDDNVVLIYSFVGMLSQEIRISGQVLQNVSLLPDSEQITEVMVTGYETISAERATGSFKNVNVENMLEQKTADNVLVLIEGEVPGLLMEEPTYNNEGATPNIVLRGINNFAGRNDVNQYMPLVVVDGFPINGISGGTESTINQDDVYQILKNISPTDIESFTVLKDAAAASIWGSQAANGVIVITTKKGVKSKKPNVTFTSSVTFKDVPDLKDDYRMSMDTYLELEEWYANSGRLRAPSKYNTRANSTASQTYYDLAQGAITQGEADAIINELKKNDFQKEYADLFLRRYTQQQYAVSVSQGSDKYQYYASLKYRDEMKSEKGQGNQEYSALLNLSAQLAKGVKFSTKLSYSKADSQNNGPMPESVFQPYDRILDDNGDYVNMTYRHHPMFVDQWMADGRPYDYHYNIKEEFELSDDTRKVRNNVFQAKLDIDLIKGLKAELSYNYQHGYSERRVFQSEKSYFVRDRINRSAIYEPIDPSRPWAGVQYTGETFFPLGNNLEGESASRWSNAYRGVLNYSGYLDADKEHFVTAIAGMEMSEEKVEERTFEELMGYDPQAVSYITYNKVGDYIDWRGRTNRGVYGSDFADLKLDRDRYVSTFTNAAYTFKEKYTVTGSWRLDDSNLFGSSSKYRNVPLWSTGLKWRMGDESFMDLPFLNRLDLRVSYGIGGRIDRGSSPFLTVSKWNDRYTNLPYASVRTFENEELRWEKTTTFNAGVDFALFNNRLSGSIEYYNRYSDDVMGAVDMNPTSGVRTMGRNYAEISNKGFELSLNYNVLSRKDLRWNMSMNMSHNKNKIEKFDGGGESVSGWAGRGWEQEGYSSSKLFAFKWAGLSETGEAQVYDKDGNIVGVNDELATKDDLEYIGDATPKFFGSYRNSVSYKGFSLDVLLSYKLGHKFFRNTFSSTTASRALMYGGNIHEDAALRWREPGDEAFTDVPALTTSNGNGRLYERYSNHLVEDASHIRLRSIGLTYQFDKKLFENNFIKGITIGANARNLGILWKATDKDIDPDYNNYGNTRKGGKAMYSFNLKVNF